MINVEQFKVSSPNNRILLEGRAVHEFSAFVGSLPLLWWSPRGDGHPVLVLPGLGASDASTQPLRSFLSEHHYTVGGWPHRPYYGLDDDVSDAVADLVNEMYSVSGRRVSLIGWSVGGLYARRIARRMHERVRQVITLASPFGDAAGDKFSEAGPTVAGPQVGPPPVPTTAVFTRTDGFCVWQLCREARSLGSESIEVESSHLGMIHHPAVVFAIADRLAQPEGQWKPFDRSGWRSFIYPNPYA